MRKVTVNWQDLRDYLNEYHQNTASGRCKADGQEWPCSVYVNLTNALDTAPLN